MKQLPVPVRGVLADALDEPATQRMWREIGRRRALASAARPSVVPRFAWAMAAAFVLVAAFFGWRARIGTASGPLRLAGGAELALQAPPESATAAGVTALDDGSRIEVFPGARLTVLENSGKVVTLLLERGRARFDVAPGGP